MSDLTDKLEALGAQVDELRRSDAASWFGQWCETFMGAVKARTGKHRYRSFHWHAFSFEFVPAIDAKHATETYLALTVEPVLVIPESWQFTCGFRFDGPTLPNLGTLNEDCYVFPESLEWTMSFTHEDHCGPYFTRREWCDASAG